MEADLSSKTAKGDLIRVRIEGEAKRVLVELARQRGLTLSDLVRSAATDAVRRMAA
jgi:DNA-binding protein YbaB